MVLMDPFYSRENIAELERRAKDAKTGKNMHEHELIEVDEYDRMKAARRLAQDLKRAEERADNEGWIDADEFDKEMGIDAYSKTILDVEQVLDKTDEYAESNIERMSHEDVFERIRRSVN